MASTLDLSLSGLASGFDWKTVVDQMAEVERAPEKRMLTEQYQLAQRNNSYASLKTELGVLQNRVTKLNDASLFDSRTANVPDSTYASASASAGTPLGTYSFHIIQRATAAQQHGTANVGGKLSASSDVSGVVLSSAGVATAITAGTFAINGHQVTIATTDTLQQVFDKISSATGGSVTASYDPDTDKIRLASSSEIVLGSATDTSNFLQVAKLYNNGTGAIASSYALGSVKTGVALSQANLAATLNDGGGTGQFKINGVAVSWNATDSLANVMNRINQSGAGVLATYDAVADQITLTNRATGDTGIGLEDVSGNFLAATGLTGGTLSRGKSLQYTVNGGPVLVSQSNTIAEASSGIAGLEVTALKDGDFSVSVASDTTTIRQAITDFIDEYNKVQALIDTETSSSTDSDGKVTAGLLASEGDATEIASSLRSLAYGQVAGLSGALKQLNDLGISTNGQDNNLTLEDADKLDAALTSNLSDVRSIFLDSTNGVGTKLAAFLDKTIGDDGTLIQHQSNITKQIADMDTQIADLERNVLTYKERLTAQFVAYETASATMNQQLSFLQKQIASWSSSS
jgi:flagellar hook-associated protein 2